MKREFTRSAFTLVEILVVVGIIAILAAILFPAFSIARAKARSASCQSNLKQIGAAMAMYIGDHERYPYAVDPADKYAPNIWSGQADAQGVTIAEMELLPDAMNAYVQSAAVWKCPSDTGFDYPDDIPWQLDNEPTYPKTCFEKYRTSYFFRTQLAFLKLSDDFLANPSQINVLFDATGDWHASGVLTWRDRRYNVLFADGHVKNIARDSLTKSWQTPVK